MPGGVIGGIVSAIMNGPEGRAAATLSIAGVDATTGQITIPERAFQFWPESISEEAEIGWAFKDIPGASHSLAQWTQNGGRTFSFEVTLSRFMLPFEDLSTVEQLLSFFQNKPEQTIPLNNKPMNISVKEQIAYLRQYYQPLYAASGDVTVAQSPPIALLNAPRLGLNEDGGDVVWCVMTQCSVNYVLTFPNGEPRLATVSLGFRQVVQWPGQNKVVLRDRTWYGKSSSFETGIGVGGGRGKNKTDASSGP